MLVDMFGNPLAVGQHVLFAECVPREIDGEQYEVPELSLYRITELDEPNVVVAEALNGDAIGELFYLSDPVRRVCVIGRDRALYDLAECYQNSTIN